MGVPSPSPPPVASESINRKPFEVDAAANGDNTLTGIRLPSVSNLQLAVFPVFGSIATVPGEVQGDVELIEVPLA